MADVDEDIIPSLDPSHHSRPSPKIDADGASSDSDADSDTAPDYRFLTTTTAKKHALPARGTKDFEPVPTQKQASTLDTSRKAMSDALSVVRVHSTRKNENVAVYLSDPVDWDGQSFEQQALAEVEDVEKREKMRQSSVLKPGEGRCVAVERLSSTFSRTMGQGDRRGWVWLLPEEALFLLERGSLDIRYQVQEGDEEDELADQSTSDTGTEDQADPDNEVPRLRASKVPLSLQGAYVAFIGKSGLTLERYIVFANLRRGGYIVQRAPTWRGPIESKSPVHDPPHTLVPIEQQAGGTMPQPSQYPMSLAYRLIQWLFPPKHKPSTVPCHNSVTGPLLSPGLYRSYGDIFRQLHLIPQYNDDISYPQPQIPTNDVTEPYLDTPQLQSQPEDTPPGTNTDPPLLQTYHINKPSALQNYRKSAPPSPDYTVVVLDARNTTIPTSTQIGDLLASMADDTLPDRKRLETRIKYGKKSVLIAVVDSGLTSYMRFSSGGFGSGNILWEENEKRKARAGGKRGGGWRGRGRGRGRGQGRGGSVRGGG